MALTLQLSQHLSILVSRLEIFYIDNIILFLIFDKKPPKVRSKAGASCASGLEPVSEESPAFSLVYPYERQNTLMD